jgi:hypothetical protein
MNLNNKTGQITCYKNRTFSFATDIHPFDFSTDLRRVCRQTPRHIVQWQVTTTCGTRGAPEPLTSGYG